MGPPGDAKWFERHSEDIVRKFGVEEIGVLVPWVPDVTDGKATLADKKKLLEMIDQRHKLGDPLTQKEERDVKTAAVKTVSRTPTTQEIPSPSRRYCVPTRWPYSIINFWSLSIVAIIAPDYGGVVAAVENGYRTQSANIFGKSANNGKNQAPPIGDRGLLLLIF